MIGSLYNAYADDLLDLGLFPESIRDTQDQWYYKKTGILALVSWLMV